LIKALTGKQVFCVFLHEMVWYTGLTNNEKNYLIGVHLFKNTEY